MNVEPDGDESNFQPGNDPKAMNDAKAGERLVVVEFKYKYTPKPFIADGSQRDFKYIRPILKGKSKSSCFNWSGTKSCAMAECFSRAHKDLHAVKKPMPSVLPPVFNSSRQFYKDTTVHDGQIFEATALKQCAMDGMEPLNIPLTEEFQAHSQSFVAAEIGGDNYFTPLLLGKDLKNNVGHLPSIYVAPAAVTPSQLELEMSTAYVDSINEPPGSTGKYQVSSVASIFFVENATSGKIVAHEPPDKNSVTNPFTDDDNDLGFGATIEAMVASVRNNALTNLKSRYSRGMNASRGGAPVRNGTHFREHQQHGAFGGKSIGSRYRSGC
jgi:hypothetical protein